MKDFKEYIYEQCKQTDLSDPEAVTALAQWLAHDLIQYHDISMEQEAKLKDLMSYNDYTEWIKEVGRKMFEQYIQGMEDSDFKEFVIANMDEIIGE